MAEGEDCFSRCLGCLNSIPTPSLIVWIVLVIAVSACTGSLMIAVQRTRDLFDDKTYIDYAELAIYPILGGMVFLATFFLIVSWLSSPRTASSVFNTPGKNVCARVLNCIILVIMAILELAWLLSCVMLTIPVGLLMLLQLLYTKKNFTCINLKYYAFSDEDKQLCGESFKAFYEDSQDTMLCYWISLVGAVLVAFSLALFMVCAGSNYVHLWENRNTEYTEVAKNEVSSGSKNSIIDTKM